MSVALFFITHEGIASSLLNIGEAIIQKPNVNMAYSEVSMDASVENRTADIESKIKHLALDDGIIFITDIYGSTPSNISQQLAQRYKAELISGVNLPMVIRLLNYRDRPVTELIEKALDGAHAGIRLQDR
ncbi:MAG: hypothetical protein IMF14_02065 [Proteobacteria bacterium]|nr:hypothetical protein [Pseudomonadota bacterium]